MNVSAENAVNSDVVISESGAVGLFFRMMSWSILGTTFAFLFNNYLTYWLGFPGFLETLNGQAGDKFALGGLQGAIYGAVILLAVGYVLSHKQTSLRVDGAKMYAISAYIIRAAYWTVLLVGLVDMLISFMRVESFLPSLVGDYLSDQLGRSQFRGPYVHFPIIILSLIIAAFTRTLGFIWLTLLVVGAEFQIVVSRFVFSYEQAFMGDLVRFWYGALFLFASSYTLIEEGHVRVDVLFAGFSQRTKGFVNAIGSVVLGMGLCWVILAMGMWSKTTLINSPILSLEVSQSGFGMYVKYIMAGFLGVFATTMMIQFCGYLLEAIADIRNEPGKRQLDAAPSH